MSQWGRGAGLMMDRRPTMCGKKPEPKKKKKEENEKFTSFVFKKSIRNNIICRTIQQHLQESSVILQQFTVNPRRPLASPPSDKFSLCFCVRKEIPLPLGVGATAPTPPLIRQSEEVSVFFKEEVIRCPHSRQATSLSALLQSQSMGVWGGPCGSFVGFRGLGGGVSLVPTREEVESFQKKGLGVS